MTASGIGSGLAHTAGQTAMAASFAGVIAASTGLIVAGTAYKRVVEGSSGGDGYSESGPGFCNALKRTLGTGIRRFDKRLRIELRSADARLANYLDRQFPVASSSGQLSLATANETQADYVGEHANALLAVASRIDLSPDGIEAALAEAGRRWATDKDGALAILRYLNAYADDNGVMHLIDFLQKNNSPEAGAFLGEVRRLHPNFARWARHL